ncbi:TetR/AcrR family transcriptional regulator [Sphingosinicella xenopeptidilytica]|uniref:TetR/AcrR family transcriptional regulator n=1 Tax=Sphingosinicella xenopeptidilytica TaxID=364098 RepID=A0ABW3C5P1_SPHXN
MATKMEKPSYRLKRSVRGPGRPQRDLNIDATILDVSERLFAKKGYSGTSMREIAENASVNQGLITYYFGSKEGLFEAVFKRRGMELAEKRHKLLDELLSRKARPSVQDLIRAFIQPQFEFKKSGPAGLAFVRIQARLHHEPDELAFRLRREVYDSSAKRYIKALCDALPKVPSVDVHYRMMFIVGTYLYMLADVSRLDDLSDGQYNTDDNDEVLERMIQFLTAGLMAPKTAISAD